MAIKGKRKPKARSGRAVTAGPRPVYVAPKVPLGQRTGAKFLVVLIIEAAIFALLIGFGEQSEATRQGERIAEFTSLVEASLGRAGDAIQLFPGGAQVLPQLPARLSELEGEAPPEAEAIISETGMWSSSLTRSADGVSEVQVPGEDLDPAQRLGLTEARDLMHRGLRMFVGLAEELRVAVQIEGAPREALIATIQAQLSVAAETFNAGYGRLQEVRTLAGLPAAAAVPGGGFPPPAFPAEGTQVVPAEPPNGGGNAGGGGGGGAGGGNG